MRKILASSGKNIRRKATLLFAISFMTHTSVTLGLFFQAPKSLLFETNLYVRSYLLAVYLMAWYNKVTYQHFNLPRCNKYMYSMSSNVCSSTLPILHVIHVPHAPIVWSIFSLPHMYPLNPPRQPPTTTYINLPRNQLRLSAVSRISWRIHRAVPSMSHKRALPADCQAVILPCTGPSAPSDDDHTFHCGAERTHHAAQIYNVALIPDFNY